MKLHLPLLLALGALLAPRAAAQDPNAPEDGSATYPWALIAEREIRGHLMEGEFKQVTGVFYDAWADELLVCDEKNSRIGIFDPEGVPLFSFGGPPLLQDPRWVRTTADGRIFVSDGERQVLKVFNYRGEPLERIQLEYPAMGDAPAGVVRIAAFELDAEENLYVADSGLQQVLVYDRELELQKTFRTERGGARFQAISGLAVSPGGLIAVVDLKGTPVQVLDPNGRLVAAFGSRDMGAENFTAPISASFDDQGYLYVVDLLRHDVKIFDGSGAFQTYFGGWFSPESRGRSPGEMLYPVDVTIAPGPEGRVYVGERFGSRVQVFEKVPKGEVQRGPRLRIPRIPRIGEDAPGSGGR
jgi:hypothetical protein